MNILLICCDALRGDVGKASGMAFDVCPCVDQLAASGTRFDHAYCTMPVCVPSRISMLTGRWPDAHRVRMNLDAKDALFTEDVYQVARRAGYKTGLCGKNHTYLKAEDLDFWREYGHEGGHRDSDVPPETAAFESWLKRLDMGVAQEPTPFPLEVQLSYRIVSDAIQFFRQAKGESFFLQVSFPEPHGPSQIPKPYWNMFDPAAMPQPVPGVGVLARAGFRMQWLRRLEEDGTPGIGTDWQRYLSNYFGAVRMVDDQISRLLGALHEHGLRGQTLIVFVADHGDYLMEYGIARKGVGLSDALAHIPMVWSGADLPASPARTREYVSMADVMPTLCDAMGQSVPEGVQGRSLWKLLQGREERDEQFASVYATAGLGGLYYDALDSPPLSMGEAPRNPHLWDTLNKVTQSGDQKMVRMEDWKLIYDMMGYGELYHLATDPHEINNLFGQERPADVQARLMQELTRWLIRSENTLTRGSVGAQLRHNDVASSQKGQG